MRLKRTVVTFTLVPALLLASAPSSGASIPETVEAMSLKEKVGQLIMFSVQGTRLTSGERELIRRHRLGGVILFARNYRDRSQLSGLTAQIQRTVRSANDLSLGALISVDQEGGVVKRFEDMPPRYSAPQMGELNDTSLTFGQGRATGRALKKAGVNIDLAPVADLDLPPEHVMRSRSFGSKPWRAGRHVRAFARGLQARRVAAAAKHFPGLGGASVNSDYGRAYVRRTRQQLRDVDGVPFRRAIAGGIRMVMLSHAIYTKYKNQRPASINRDILRRLRRQFDFKGVAISDALEPVSWWFEGDVARTCEATIKAGVDIALLAGNVQAARSCAGKIKEAVRSGSIRKKRLDKAVTRVLRLKRWLGVFEG